MKPIALVLILAAMTLAADAQTPAKPASAASAVRKTTGASGVAASRPAGLKLPPGVPPVRGYTKTAFSLKYQDIKIGTGAVAEPNKMYKVFYTGYLGANGRADDGHKFDSSDDHRRPILDKDGKPEMGEDGKPKLGDPEPLDFPQGFGRLIPGFDQGFDGMRIGGKRRIFIPWQLAYGAHGRPGPDAAHPGIPPKSDLIFDVELVDVTDLQMPQNHPGMGIHQMPGQVPPRPGTVPPPAHPAAPAQPEAPPSGSATPPTPGAAPAQPAASPQPTSPTTPPGTPQPQSK
jgi:peptidylprolyl isomerase